MQEMRDPSLTVLGVFTESPGHGSHASCSSTPAPRRQLLDSWAALVGRGRRPSYLKVNPLAGKAGGDRRSVQRDDGACRAMSAA